MPYILLATEKMLLQIPQKDWDDLDTGDFTVITGPSKDAASYDALRRRFRRLEICDNYETTDLVERRAVALAEGGKVDGILSLSEIDVGRSARIRALLGIPGQTEAAARYFRNKLLMKRRAWEHGVAVPFFSALHGAKDLDDFIRTHGFPIVVKPIDGRGSFGVEVLRDEADVLRFLGTGSCSSGGFYVETFVDGDMYRVDGVYVDGTPVTIHAGRYFKDCLAFLSGATIGTHSLDDHNPLRERIEAFAHLVLEKALPTPPTGIFHLQLFHTPDDRLVLCEVACRLGGGTINEEVRAATGVDLRKTYLLAATGRLSCEKVKMVRQSGLSARIIIPRKRGRLESIPQHCPFEWVVNYIPYGKPGEVSAAAQMTNAEVAGIVFAGESEAVLQHRALELDRWFQRETRWTS